MDTPSKTQEPKIGLPTAVGVTLLLLLKTAVLINDSLLFGRLAIPPPYDDVSYFMDAMERINVFHAAGLRGVIAGIISSPPHSPYSTLAAFAGFLVSGGARPAPYVVNALVVAGLTLLWLVMFRVGPLSAWLVAVTIISTTWFDNAVTIFHPDLIAGYGAAIVASLAIFQHEVLVTTRRMIAAGVSCRPCLADQTDRAGNGAGTLGIRIRCGYAGVARNGCHLACFLASMLDPGFAARRGRWSVFCPRASENYQI